MKKVTSMLSVAVLLLIAFATTAQTSWYTRGNSVVKNAGLALNHFIGTNEAYPLKFRTNNTTRGILNATGSWSITSDSIYQVSAKNYAMLQAISNTTNGALSQAQMVIKGSTGVMTLCATSEAFTPHTTWYGAGMTILRSSASAANVVINTADVPHVFCINGSGTTNAVLKLTTTASYVRRSGGSEEQIISAAAVNTVGATSPNRTIQVVIGGVTYYIAAKTTND